MNVAIFDTIPELSGGKAEIRIVVECKDSELDTMLNSLSLIEHGNISIREDKYKDTKNKIDRIFFMDFAKGKFKFGNYIFKDKEFRMIERVPNPDKCSFLYKCDCGQILSGWKPPIMGSYEISFCPNCGKEILSADLGSLIFFK